MKNKIVTMIKNHKKVAIISAIVALFVILSLVIVFCVVRTTEKNRVDITKQYNEAVMAYNAIVDKFYNAAENCMLDNIEGLYIPEKLIIVSENKKDVNKSFDEENTIKKVKADIVTINEMTKELEANIQIVEQIKEPTEQWVVERLGKIEGITEIGSVTVETDINAMLGEEGGYTSCTYFGVDVIDSSAINGEDIVAKGTDAGGAVEVYANVADAEARCDYLEEYTGTLLYSGSYAIVGTMVIRTSYKLTDAEQLELTNKITMEFTKVY